MKTFSKNPVHIPKKEMAHVAESTALTAQPYIPSRPMTVDGEGNAVYKPGESKKSQMRNNEAVVKIDGKSTPSLLAPRSEHLQLFDRV